MVPKSLILCHYTRCIPLLYLCCKEKQLLLYLVSFGYFTCILINPRRILFSFSFEVFAIMLKGFFWLKRFVHFFLFHQISEWIHLSPVKVKTNIFRKIKPNRACLNVKRHPRNRHTNLEQGALYLLLLELLLHLSQIPPPFEALLLPQAGLDLPLSVHPLGLLLPVLLLDPPLSH